MRISILSMALGLMLGTTAALAADPLLKPGEKPEARFADSKAEKPEAKPDAKSEPKPEPKGEPAAGKSRVSAEEAKAGMHGPAAVKLIRPIDAEAKKPEAEEQKLLPPPRNLSPYPSYQAPPAVPHRPARPKPRKDPHAHAAEAHKHIHWSYEGEGAPERWGDLQPEYKLCATGQRQSPIDIREGIKLELEPPRFDYRPSMFRVVDNGHTIQVNLPPGNTLTVMGRSYELLQFHFHRPSEERIAGKAFDMVAHLVHKDLDGRLAVVAVLLDKGISAHPTIQTIWNYLPLEKNVEQGPQEVFLDLNMLLPSNRQYYTYMGSLTTPPCSEGVLWMVMKQPVPLSQEQINVFARLYKHNARPIQPSHGRMIKESR